MIRGGGFVVGDAVETGTQGPWTETLDPWSETQDHADIDGAPLFFT